MPPEPLNLVLQRLRRLVHAEPPLDLTDAELLRRFIDTREEAAFALLVQRHGPMVLGVCRRILRDRHATEDAFSGALGALLVEQTAPAAVPALLSLAAVRAVMSGTLSAAAATMAQEVVVSMGASRLKGLACFLVMLGIVAGGTISAGQLLRGEQKNGNQAGRLRSVPNTYNGRRSVCRCGMRRSATRG